MKKLALLFALLMGVVLGADAQFKPEGGEKNLEVNFSPLGGSNISIPGAGIKFRSFNSSTSALRLGVFLGLESSSEITQDEDSDTDAAELTDNSSSFSINIQPGIEKHMAGTDRLSPYMGAYVNIGYTSTTEKMETQWGPETSDVGTQTDKSGSLNLGLNAVAGFDWYFTNDVYLGTEFGFGVAYSSDLTNKTEFEGFDPNPDAGESNVGNGSSLQLGPNVVGQLRLGWLF